VWSHLPPRTATEHLETLGTEFRPKCHLTTRYITATIVAIPTSTVKVPLSERRFIHSFIHSHRGIATLICPDIASSGLYKSDVIHSFIDLGTRVSIFICPSRRVGKNIACCLRCGNCPLVVSVLTIPLSAACCLRKRQ
jgi:hypothetical protein